MKYSLALTSASLATLQAVTVLAAPNHVRRASPPSVKTATVLGNVADPSINRDSCAAATEPIAGRALWTCRDSQPYGSDGRPTLPIWSSSASWSDFGGGGTTPELRMYGGHGSREPFFTYEEDECAGNSAGLCDDGTRYALWPDSPPLVAGSQGGKTKAYSWIRKTHIRGDLSEVDKDPATSLYEMTYDTSTGDADELPTVRMVNENFWWSGTVGFGAYGNMIRDGTAYLWGRPSSGLVFLARVPAASITDRSQYEFYTSGAWSLVSPANDDQSSHIEHAGAGGQGTFFYSVARAAYVWIGQAGLSVSADFYITTAPRPEGPWAEPVLLYKGENGNGPLPGYSLQANPGLMKGDREGADGMYLTYTKQDVVDGVAVYSTPLIWVEFE